jgi:UDP-N-acetylglucosamine 4-epimerase
MSRYEQLQSHLREHPRTWLVTGAAGFIGSHLLQRLLLLGQRVIGLDDFSTGSRANLSDVQAQVPPEAWAHFELREGTVARLNDCRGAAEGAEIVLHEAGFISVPLSIEHPLECHATNVTGTVNLLTAAREHGIRRFVFASSSAVYGDDPRTPKHESHEPRPLSPYGVSKWMDELYAAQFAAHHGIECVGLRYFNVFGPRQNPSGGYAAVIPQWVSALVEGRVCQIHGDGGQTRDFCPVANVVQANVLAGGGERAPANPAVYNVALGRATNLNDLHAYLRDALAAASPGLALPPPMHGAPRPGDIRHSTADIGMIQRDLGFEPAVTFEAGLAETVRWYAEAHARNAKAGKDSF